MRFSSLKGKILTNVEVGDREITFITTQGRKYRMYHSQDCCEDVYVEDIVGNIANLLNTPILKAYKETSRKNPSGVKLKYQDDSFTWTFYNIFTVKGDVTIRWYGGSNGYYSEDVEFEEVT